MVSDSDSIDLKADPNEVFAFLMGLCAGGTKGGSPAGKLRVVEKDPVARRLMLSPPPSFGQLYHGEKYEVTVQPVSGGARASITGNWRNGIINILANPEKSFKSIKSELMKRFDLL